MIRPLDVVCSYCGASVGQECHTRTLRQPLYNNVSHTARHKAAARATRQAKDAELAQRSLLEYGPLYQHGRLEIINTDQINEINLAEPLSLGVQVAWDGRVWLCINGISWLRFKPERSES